MVGTRASAEPGRAPLKPKFCFEWMNVKNILGFKLCAEAEKFFQTPWSEHGIAYIAATEKRIDQMMDW